MDVTGMWPDVHLSITTFAAFLREHKYTLDNGDTRTPDIDLGELYLVCACLQNVPRAGELFQTQYFSPARSALFRMSLSPGAASDIEQLAWQKLFVSQRGARPKILDYAGDGNLATLVRVVLVRTAISELRKHKHEVLYNTADELEDLPEHSCNPELALMRSKFRKDFAPAFAAAFATLSERDRNLLRLRYVDGLQVEQVARLYRVHRVTASRMLSRIHRDLRRETRSRLRSRLQLCKDNLDSLIRLVDSQLEMSIEWCHHTIDPLERQ